MVDISKGMESQEKLAQLTQVIAEGNDSFSRQPMRYHDDVSHLSEQERFYWARVIRSILSAELLENFLIDPLIQALPTGTQLEKTVKAFLTAQAADEQKHQLLFQHYLTETFQYQRKRKTIANRIFIDGFLGQTLWYLKRNPCVGIALIYMYEDYSNHFYHYFKKKAQEARLPQLFELITFADKDEHRHTAGIKMILNLVRGSALEVSGINRGLFRIFARVFSLDMTTRKWAIYNREVRNSMIGIGLDPDILSAGIQKSYQRTLGLLKV